MTPQPRADRYEEGRERRRSVPLAAHAELATEARDPLGILHAQDEGRLERLVPIRWERMSASPFAMYRGAAAVMASDLAALPHTAIGVQLCGDAHLSNFGAYAAPDRRLVFDLNDFDETAPGPFEWDVKRLAASVVLAGLGNGLGRKSSVKAAVAAVRVYRERMGVAAGLDPLTLWNLRVELDTLEELVKSSDSASGKQLAAMRVKATRKDHAGAVAKLTEIVDGRRRIISRPPLVKSLSEGDRSDEIPRIERFVADYAASLASERQHLMQRYRLTDLAMYVVGVGSVGTRCMVGLFESGDGEPLMLQIKQATSSVLEPHLGGTASHSGQRVVEGQRVMQSASDPFLGWSRYYGKVGEFDYYVRQLWDGKASANVEQMGTKSLTRYASLCGAVLARAHARTGDAALISGYLGDTDEFDEALGQFGIAYAKQSQNDFAAMVDASASGLEVQPSAQR